MSYLNYAVFQLLTRKMELAVRLSTFVYEMRGQKEPYDRGQSLW